MGQSIGVVDVLVGGEAGRTRITATGRSADGEYSCPFRHPTETRRTNRSARARRRASRRRRRCDCSGIPASGAGRNRAVTQFTRRVVHASAICEAQRADNHGRFGQTDSCSSEKCGIKPLSSRCHPSGSCATLAQQADDNVIAATGVPRGLGSWLAAGCRASLTRREGRIVRNGGVFMRAAVIDAEPRKWLTDRNPRITESKIAEVHAGTNAGRLSVPCTSPILPSAAPRKACRIWGLNWWDDGTAIAAAYGPAEQFDGWLRSGEIAMSR